MKDPTAYFVNGHWSFHGWLDGHLHGAPGVEGLAAGNILFAQSVVAGFSVLEPPLRFFDVLSLALLAGHTVREDPEAVGYSEAVTSRFTGRVENPDRRFCEYDYMPSEYADGKTRDLRLYRSFQRPELREGLLGSVSAGSYWARPPSSEAGGFYADSGQESARVAYVSRHFSLKFYLENLFRHRPLAVRLIDRTHTMMTGLFRRGK